MPYFVVTQVRQHREVSSYIQTNKECRTSQLGTAFLF